MTSQELENEVLRIKAELDKKTTISVLLGAVLLGFFGYTSFFAIPQEASKAVATAVGEKVNALVTSLNKAKEDADALLHNQKIFSHAQQGTSAVGSSNHQVKSVSVIFQKPFETTPVVIAVPHSESYSDTFALTVRNVSATGFTVNIARADVNASPQAEQGWGQTLSFDWLAWQR